MRRPQSARTRCGGLMVTVPVPARARVTRRSLTLSSCSSCPVLCGTYHRAVQLLAVRWGGKRETESSRDRIYTVYLVCAQPSWYMNITRVDPLRVKSERQGRTRGYSIATPLVCASILCRNLVGHAHAQSRTHTLAPLPPLHPYYTSGIDPFARRTSPYRIRHSNVVSSLVS